MYNSKMTSTTETPFALNAHFVTLNNLISNLGEDNYQDEKKVNKIVKEWYVTIKTEYKNYLETNKQTTKNYVKNLDEKITEIKNIIIDMYITDELTDENQEKLIAVGIEFEDEEEEIELCKGCGEVDGEEQYDWYCEDCRAEKLGHHQQATEVEEEAEEEEAEEEEAEEVKTEPVIRSYKGRKIGDPMSYSNKGGNKIWLDVPEPADPDVAYDIENNINISIYTEKELKDNTLSNISNNQMSELEQLKKRVAELEAENNEKNRQQKISENKTEWFEKKYPEWIKAQEKEWKIKLLDLMKKNDIPDLWGCGGDWYEKVFGKYYNEGYYNEDETKQINTNVTHNEILVKHINKAIGFRQKDEKKTDMKRATPTKICRESDKLFECGDVLKHTATKDKTTLNIIYCYYDKDQDKFELCSVVFNMLNEIVSTSKLGHSFKNLNQFIIYNNKQYAPEKVQKETAWNGSVKLCRNKVWINTKDLEPL